MAMFKVSERAPETRRAVFGDEKYKMQAGSNLTCSLSSVHFPRAVVNHSQQLWYFLL